MLIKKISIYLLPIIVFSLIIIGCTNKNNQFSNVTKDFEDSIKGELSLCFYPSTIQMLNIKKDTTFNNIFKGIRKLKVVRYSRSSDTSKIVNITEWAEKIRSDKYVDLLRFKQGKQDVMIFLYKNNEEPKKLFGIVSDSAQVMMIDLVGTIAMNHILDVAKGNLDLGGFNSVVNFNKSMQTPKNKRK